MNAINVWVAALVVRERVGDPFTNKATYRWWEQSRRFVDRELNKEIAYES
jgi:hypothetical protein